MELLSAPPLLHLLFAPITGLVEGRDGLQFLLLLSVGAVCNLPLGLLNF